MSSIKVTSVTTMIDFAAIPPEGLKARIRHGECYGREIVWGKPIEATITRTEKANIEGEPGINWGHGYGFAGVEESTGTYWRYKHEVNPDSYREHCMQILELL